MARGAGHTGGHGVANGEDGVPLLVGEGLVLVPGRDVLLQLLHVGHAGEHHGDLGHALQEAERPGGNGLVGTQRLELGLVLLGQRGQLSAAKRLHHPHGNAVLSEQGDLLGILLEVPVDVVELQLAELHLLAVLLEEGTQHGQRTMAGEAQVTDAAGPLLLEQVAHGAKAVVGQIVVNVGLGNVMAEVEVEVLDPALLELLLEDLLHLAKIAVGIARELGGQVEAVTRILGERATEHLLGMSAVIAPGGVVVVDALLHGVVDHGSSYRFVDGVVVAIYHGQTHGAKTKAGQLQILKVAINHERSPLLWPSFPVTAWQCTFILPASMTGRQYLFPRACHTFHA